MDERRRRRYAWENDHRVPMSRFSSVFSPCWTVCAVAALGATAAISSCTYDFDAPFSDTPSGTGTAASTGTAGAGGETPTGTVGGGGTTSTGSTGGTGGTGQGGSTGDEDCSNGTDDDGDQLNDCADPDCQLGWECAVLAGTDWSEPVGFYRGDDALPVPDCEDPFTTASDYGLGLSAAAASCNPCSCDGTALCDVADSDYFSTSGCASFENSHSPSAAGACDAFSTPDLDSVGAYASDPVNGSCTPTGGDVANLPAVQWQENVRICEGALETGASGGCNEGQACVPLPTSDFRRCVTRSGDLSCTAPYTQKTLVYRTVADQRGCTDCSCSNPTFIDCDDAQTLIYQTADCSGSPYVVVDHSAGCQNFLQGSVINGSARFTVNPDFGGCYPSGGQPTGSATGDNPITVCCLPSG